MWSLSAEYFGVKNGIEKTIDKDFEWGDQIFNGGAEVNFERSTINIVTPLSNMGVWYFYASTQKLFFTARVDWLSISINDYSGNMWNLGAEANYQFYKNIRIGLKSVILILLQKLIRNIGTGNFQ